MKRFGNAILDPRHVRAVAPFELKKEHGITAGIEMTDPQLGLYAVLFLDGSMLSLDAESAVLLMAELVSP